MKTMQCPNCKFENIPGQAKCFQCGCILESTIPMDVNPPRMLRWQKPYRFLCRGIRKLGVSDTTAPEWLESVSYRVIGSLVFSLIPGLGHLMQKRFSQIRWLVLAWAILLAVGMFFLGKPLGIFFISSAIGTHAYILVDCVSLDKSFIKKIVFNSIAAIMLFFLYFVIVWRTLFGILGCYGAVEISSMQIHRNDYFLARRITRVSEDIHRGDFYILQTSIITNNGHGRRRSLVVCQIVGLPNETVETKDGVFYIDNAPLDKDIYPVQDWINNRYLKTTLGNGQYFVNIIYSSRNLVPSNMIFSACIVNENEFRGKAFAKWQPWYERRFLEDRN